MLVRSENGKKAAKTMAARGTFSGWHNRRGEPSYPEKYMMSVFENENISGWVRELKVGRWFLDFAFQDLKIAVEVDGRQHQDHDRKVSDEKKDAFLRQTGWEVIRIVWKKPKTQAGRDFLHPQIHSLVSRIKAK
jgi:very-short-patch-repair endonuclease